MGKWNKLQPLERWNTKIPSSSPYRILKKYDLEIRRFMTSFYYSQKYTYAHLKKDNVVWSDKVIDKFPNNKVDGKLTIKMWSDDFDKFDHWIRLNFLFSTCSFFEIYMDSVITESIQSDPGLLFGSSKCIDGIKLLKIGHEYKKKEFIDKITDCLKGDWNSRLSGITKLFPDIPSFFQDNLSDLEHIRILRNDVAHAFGRDIEESRNYELTQIMPMQSLSRNKCAHYHYKLISTARYFDQFLMKNHIGNYEPLLYYHHLYPQVKDRSKGDKLVLFKEKIGKDRSSNFITKDLCRQIIMYYDSL